MTSGEPFHCTAACNEITNLQKATSRTPFSCCQPPAWHPESAGRRRRWGEFSCLSLDDRVSELFFLCRLFLPCLSRRSLSFCLICSFSQRGQFPPADDPGRGEPLPEIAWKRARITLHVLPLITRSAKPPTSKEASWPLSPEPQET